MSIVRVAQVAGIPYSTTWRVINRASGVSSRATQAVRKAMDQIGYVQPVEQGNGRANRRSPRTRQRSVALLYLRESSPVSISILRSVQQIVGERELNLICGHVVSAEDLPPAVQAGQVDGILGYGQLPMTEVSERLRSIPAVWMMSPLTATHDAWGDRVMPDHRAIGSLAAKYLLDRGHRHLAFLNPAPVFYSQLRGQAFTDYALGKAKSVRLFDYHPAENWAVSEVPTAAAIGHVLDSWAAVSPRPSGLFVSTDAICVMLYRQLVRRGVRIGRDVELISCDNLQDLLSALDPAPTSIDLNREMIARLAVERLLLRMKENHPSPPVQIAVSPTLHGDRP